MSFSQKSDKIHIYRLRKILPTVFGLLLLAGLYSLLSARTTPTTSYWLWAGVTARDAPSDSELYIYQGLLTTEGGRTVYRRIGLYPYPLPARKFYLVYRLDGDLPAAETVVSLFQKNIALWQRHGAMSAGLQLDFDSPTAKLLVYSSFLQEVRKRLPKNYALSVTGLGDWAMNGNLDVMRNITVTANGGVVFQLYQGWQPLPELDGYIGVLCHYPLPFRIGLLSRYPEKDYIARLQSNDNFKGVIYFIQKKP